MIVMILFQKNSISVASVDSNDIFVVVVVVVVLWVCLWLLLMIAIKLFSKIPTFGATPFKQKSLINCPFQ